MIRRAEPSQLHLFTVLDLLGVRVTPFNRDLAIGVCVDEHVKGAITVKLGQESN